MGHKEGVSLGSCFRLNSMNWFARASDQATKFTFSQPVSIPGHVLPRGKYHFAVIDCGFDFHVEQIYDLDES